MLLHYHEKLLQTQWRLAQQGSRALFTLISSFKRTYVTTEQKMFLFDSMVGSVLSYASEVWGFHRAGDVDLVLNRFLKYVLNEVRMFLHYF